MKTEIAIVLAVIVIALHCEHAACASAVWSRIEQKQQKLWIDKRAFGGESVVKKNKEVGIFAAGGALQKELYCCTDSFIYYPFRNISSQEVFENVGKNTLVNSTNFELFKMVTIGDAVYSFGGTILEPGTKARNELYKYCVTKNKWELVDKTGPNLVYHTMVATSDGENLIVFGGKSSVDASAGFSNQLYFFNMKNKTWTQFSPSYGKQWPTARSSHEAVIYTAADGTEHMAILNGESYDGCVKDAYWTLNIKKMVWEWLPYPDDYLCMSDFEVWSFGANSPVGDFAMIGGMGSDGIWDLDIYIFSVKNNQWTKIKNDINVDGPLGFRGVYSGVIESNANGVVVGMVAGCYAGQIGCDMDNQVWRLVISP